MEWLSEALHELLVPPTPVQQLGRATRSIERDARRLARVREDCDAREKRALAELRKLSRGNATHNQLRAAARDVARVRATRDQVGGCHPPHPPLPYGSRRVALSLPEPTLALVAAS